MSSLFILHPCQHDKCYVDGWSLIQVHTDERTQFCSVRFSLVVNNPSTNQGLNFSERATELALVATASLNYIHLP